MNVVAARLGVTLATLTTAVGQLVDKGFITRTRCIDDRRKVLISLTKRGKQMPRPVPSQDDQRRRLAEARRRGRACVRACARQGQGFLRRTGLSGRLQKSWNPLLVAAES